MRDKNTFSEKNGWSTNYLVLPMFFWAALAIISLVVSLYIEDMKIKDSFESISYWIGRVCFLIFLLWGPIGSFIYLRFDSAQNENQVNK